MKKRKNILADDALTAQPSIYSPQPNEHFLTVVAESAHYLYMKLFFFVQCCNVNLQAKDEFGNFLGT